MGNAWYMRKGNLEYKAYLSSKEWKVKANARMDLDNHLCVVCGNPATEVHHVTYDRFKNELMDDLVSLCRRCHSKAEEIYDPAVTPWAMDDILPGGNSFTAAMRVDADRIAPIVFAHIKDSIGDNFESLMSVRQPSVNSNKYWQRLRSIVYALCGKRYALNCKEDRFDIMLSGVDTKLRVLLLAQIEHDVRNSIQSELHDTVMRERASGASRWADVAERLGIKIGTVTTIRNDDGRSFGPSLREAVIHYCMLDAANGHYLEPGAFDCLSDDDYATINSVAEYANRVTHEEMEMLNSGHR